MLNNTDPLLSDSFNCRPYMSPTPPHHTSPTRATSEKADIYYGKEKKCLKNPCTHIAQLSGFLLFLFTLFVNKVVLSEAYLYELCWIECKSMLLAYHGNLSLLKKSPQVPCVLITKRTLKSETMSSNSSNCICSASSELLMIVFPTFS